MAGQQTGFWHLFCDGKKATENKLRYFPRRSSTHQLKMNSQNKGISDNDVNGTSLNEGAASGRGGSEASQVVIKRNPYGMLKIGTWNVRILARSGKLENVIREMERYKVNILGMTEGYIQGDKKHVVVYMPTYSDHTDEKVAEQYDKIE